jgi:hypothetical protein
MNSLICLALLFDAGLPLITLNLFAVILFLIPVIIVEALLYKKWLRLATWPAFKSSGLSNIVSTIAGYAIIIVVGSLLGLGFSGFHLQHWYSPLEGLIARLDDVSWMQIASHAHFLIPAITLLTLLPFFIVSYLIEYLVVRAMLRPSAPAPSDTPSRRLRRAVRNANLVTYLVMLIIVSVYLTLLASSTRPFHP